MDQDVKEDNDKCGGASGWTRDIFNHEDQNAAPLMNIWRQNTRLQQEQLRAEEIARRRSFNADGGSQLSAKQSVTSTKS